MCVDLNDAKILPRRRFNKERSERIARFCVQQKKARIKNPGKGKKKKHSGKSGVGLASQGLQLVRDRRPFGVTVFKIRLQDLVFSQCLF